MMTRGRWTRSRAIAFGNSHADAASKVPIATRAAGAMREVVNLLRRVRELRENPMRVANQRFPIDGRSDAAIAALEEGDPEVSFEVAYGLGHGRLRHADRLAGAHHAAHLGDRPR